ncbi:MAG: TlpA family protein disulfide reductase [Planctomycetota bacterium]|jgi:thiol-disulfide isomerase/thioredoxin
MRLSNVIAATLALTLPGAALGADEKLAVGDQAPGLNIETWVKGQEVKIEPGKVYIIEFWATWCAPCKKSIPHLTELQKKYGPDKLVIVGITDEAQEIVESFVQKQGDNMDYTVATDRRGACNRLWMRAAGLQGIPAAFIVDRGGKVAFIGNPLDDAFDQTLASVMSGRFDPALQKQAAPILKSARRARTVRNWRMALRHYDQVIEMDAMVFADVAIERFSMILLDMKDSDEAYEYARSGLIDGKFAKDSGALRMLAEEIATNPDIERAGRDLEVAMVAADKSLQLEGRRDPESLAAVALVHYHRGEIQEAVQLQTRAYFLARPEVKAGFKRVLGSYRDAADRAGTG